VQTDERVRKAAQRRRALMKSRKTVGSVIAIAIRDSDKKQSEVAKECGMTDDMLSDIVTGQRKTELGEIQLIAKAIGEDPLVMIRRMLNW
jgi:hypothetical protein